jgi:hypothetical protein
MRRAGAAATLFAALLGSSAALAEGGAGMAFAAGNSASGETLGAAAGVLFAGACAAFVAIVVLLGFSHAALRRCGASLDAAERSLPEEETR